MAVWKVPTVIKPQATRALTPFLSGGVTADVNTGDEHIVRVSTTGFPQLEARLRSLPKVFRDAAGIEMAEMLHEVIGDSKDNYVPRDTGNLADSGNADEYDPSTDANIISLRAWFGAAPSESQMRGARDVEFTQGVFTREPWKYALDQHENMQYVHPRGGGPKYLEIPFLNKVPEMLDRIARAADIASNS